jgi:hypothetical protein
MKEDDTGMCAISSSNVGSVGRSVGRSVLVVLCKIILGMVRSIRGGRCFSRRPPPRSRGCDRIRPPLLV